MDGLPALLGDFKNITCEVRRGVTHTFVRITGDAVKMKKSGFVADFYVLRRTGEFSIARIDNKDEKTLRIIHGFLKQFKF